jgi:heme exporter protein D
LVGLWVVVVFKWKEVLRKEDKTRGEERRMTAAV